MAEAEGSQDAIDERVFYLELGGKRWKLPVLSLRQNRRIHVPLVRLVAGTFSQLNLSAADLSQADIDDMMFVVQVALTKAYPEITAEAFEDMEIGSLDLVRAIPFIVTQSGIFGPGTAPVGEGVGTTSP